MRTAKLATGVNIQATNNTIEGTPNFQSSIILSLKSKNTAPIKKHVTALNAAIKRSRFKYIHKQYKTNEEHSATISITLKNF